MLHTSGTLYVERCFTYTFMLHTSGTRDVVQSITSISMLHTSGSRDAVRCFSCDGGLQLWDPSDDPWIEHCIHFPHCLFLIETKGEDNIELTRSQHDQASYIG